MKLLVYTIAVIFSLQSIAGAVPVLVENAPAIDKDIFIPESYGIIEKSSFDDYLSSRFVILLKDAHCNYDAQHNIARILEVLVRDYKIDLVAVEGAVGVLDFSRFWKLENEPARERMADNFVKKGILSGPEYLTITKDGKLSFNIYGIEDERLYVENFTTFRQTIDHIEEAGLFINEISRITKGLKQRLYPKELLEFDNKAGEYYDNTISLTDWVKELNKEAVRLGIVLKEYPNISLTVDSIAMEEQIDFKKVEMERASAIGHLEKVLSKEDLKRMIEESLMFRLGKIASSDYYKYLEEILDPGGAGNFPNLMRYIQLVKFQSWINNDALFNEIDNLENRIKEAMFHDNIQRQLNDLSKRARILNNLFKLTLNREDLGYYMGNKAEFLPANLLSFLNIQAPLHNIPMSMLLSNEGFLDTVTKVISSGEKFYYIAVERDVSLVENTLRVMEERQKASAIMVIGGFHTDGVINLFETKGIGYLVISPKIVRAEKAGLYLSLMMDKKITLAQKTSSLAFPKLMADGEGNVKLLMRLGAEGWRIELLDMAIRLYNRFLGREAKAVVSDLPFNITIDASGAVTVDRNPGYRGEEISSMLIEWFRMGLEEVLKKNPTLAGFISGEGNAERYLNTTALMEYKQRTGHTMQEGILRRATLGFITFYLGMAMAYEKGGLLSLPEELRGESLPESIRAQETKDLPAFRDELVSRLIEKGLDSDVAETIANYLFTMPAYRELRQTQFFNAFIGLARDILGAEAEDLLNKLQAYRYLQAYLSSVYEGMEVEELARYVLSKGEGNENFDRLLARKRELSGWRDINWVAEAATREVQNEDSVKDPLKRDLYVAALTRTGMADALVASDRYRKEKEHFEEGLASGEEVLGRLKNRTFIHDVSMYLGSVKEIEAGKYEYSDLGSPGINLVRAIQLSKVNDQYFLYETDIQREAMRAYLAGQGIEVEDRQFVKLDEYGDIERRDRVIITMISDAVKGKVSAVKGDRLLVGNPEGTDLMLMARLALVIAGHEDIEAQRTVVENELKDLLRKYYLGAVGETEIQELLKNISITEGIFRIILPLITPFVKDYYETLRAREIISKAA